MTLYWARANACQVCRDLAAQRSSAASDQKTWHHVLVLSDLRRCASHGRLRQGSENPGREGDLAHQEGNPEAERNRDQGCQGKFKQVLQVYPTYREG